MPPDFASLRARWEWGHAAHATLLFVSFLATVTSVLVDIPSRAVAAEARRSVASRAA